MKVFILAAGQGTRLSPLTDNKPKCLVELNGVSLLERQIKVLKDCGLSDVLIVGGYKAEMIQALGYPVVKNERFSTTNMVATLFSAREYLSGKEEIIVAYGDIVYEPRVLNTLLQCHAPVCVVVDKEWERYWSARMPNPLSDAETLRLDARGHILELGKKPKSLDDIQGQYVGLIKFRADVIKPLITTYDAMDHNAMYDGKDYDNMFMTSFIQYLIDKEWHVQSALVTNGWLEVDTIKDINLYQQLSSEGKLFSFYNY